MLAKRVATAVVLLALLIGAMALGQTAFSIVAAVLVAIGMFEWLRLAGHANVVAALLALGGAVALWLIDRTGLTLQVRAVFAAVALSTWCAVFVLLYAVERGATARVGRHAGTLLCLILMGAAWFALMDLSRAGWVVLISALAIVWIADIAAYFAGRAFGKRKLAPHISPGKTWAGVIGAVLTVVLVAEFLAYAWPQTPLFTTTLVQRVSIATGVLLICLLVAMSIVGDLFESLIKRQAGAKDSGTLLPGHGGVLDRVDALLPVLPALQLIRYGFAS